MNESARCRELAPLLAERASGTLASGDDAAISGHLEGCARCRLEAARCAELLARARPRREVIDDAELSRLAAGALASLHDSRRRSRVSRRWWAGGCAAAAAAAAVALAPAAMRRGAAPAHGWEPPDPEALWIAAGPTAARAADEGEGDDALFAFYDGAEADEPARRTP
jgi:hypothetical protein